MDKFCFVHLSDIHFGQERAGNKPIHEDVRIELLRDCENLRESYGPADGIIVTGDIAFSGKPEQYQIAGSWLDDLAKKVGCADTAVSVIPGNHDVDLNCIGTTCDIVQQNLRSVPLEKLDALLQSVGQDDVYGNPLLPKLAAYREFASRYGCDFSPDKDNLKRVYPYWEKKLHLEQKNELRFVGMTSVLVSDKSDGLGKMVLGNQQYIINREPFTEIIVLTHHPLEWFRDQEQVEKYLKRARVILCGHEHRLYAHESVHENGTTLWIHAGSTNSPEGRDPYQYRYNWIVFSAHEHDNNACLEVTIIPRVWDSDNPRFGPDLSLSQGYDTANYHLACPEFRYSALEPELISNDENEKDKGINVNPVPIGEVEEMVKDDEPFTRLRYLFWKHLNWSERLKVLADLDILPSTLDQPIPQIMERLAIDNARDEGKLPALWDAIMAFVPDDQKEPNPFIH